MRHWTRAAVTAILSLALAGCATTSFTSSWKAPDAKPLGLRGLKVAAVVLSPRESASRGAEFSLAREITKRGAIGMPGYGLVPKEERGNPEKAKARLEAAGVVAVVVMRPVSKEKEVTYTPGTAGYWGGPAYRGGFYGYYGRGYGAVGTPGYLSTNTIVTIETLVYDLRTDQLVWAGMSETTNPEKLDEFVVELAGAAAKELEKQGLIQPAKK